ncbi:MAG: adenosine kinase [Pseudomonadota bacterium]
MAEIQVAALGNAIVDVIAQVDDSFPEKHGIVRGGMMLIDTAQAEEITGAFADTVMVAGGSAGNTVACISSFGGQSRFIAKVADDDLGTVYRESMSALGALFETPSYNEGVPTGRSLISVTPDAQRSMATFLGAAVHLSADDIQEGELEGAQVCYIEGYLFEGPLSRGACIEAASRAKGSGRFTAMTLADSGMVERQLTELKPFLIEQIDMIFANDDEAKMLTGEDDVEAAAKAMRDISTWGAITLGEKGSLVFGPQGDLIHVDAIAPTELVDTTGAGDAYAAGFLFGFTTCAPLDVCGKLGSLAASEVISHMGARPETSLKKLAAERGLLAHIG